MSTRRYGHHKMATINGRYRPGTKKSKRIVKTGPLTTQERLQIDKGNK